MPKPTKKKEIVAWAIWDEQTGLIPDSATDKVPPALEVFRNKTDAQKKKVDRYEKVVPVRIIIEK